MMQKWWTSETSGLPRIGVVLAEVPKELDIDKAGKVPISVDGVQKWLWHLRPQDLLPHEDPSQDVIDVRLGREVYTYIRHYRIPGHFLSGPAIAILWNENGIHYILVAQDRAPMDEQVLLRMANSMAPVKDALKLPAR
jgi:hypothetical protein